MSLFPPLLPLSSIDSFFFPPLPEFRLSYPSLPAFEPSFADDIADLGHAIQVSIPNPKIPLGNIRTKVAGDILTIQGQSKSQHQAKREGYYQSQASQSSFIHRVKLPTNKVDNKQVKIRLDDTQSQLLISLPKK